MQGEGATEVLEVMPGSVCGDEDGGHEFAGVVIHSEQEGLFIFIWPPLVDGGIMLPEFAQASAFPAATRLWDGCWSTDKEGEVSACVSSDRFAITNESESGCKFVRGELVVGRALEGQKGLQELLDLGGPCRSKTGARH